MSVATSAFDVPSQRSAEAPAEPPRPLQAETLSVFRVLDTSWDGNVFEVTGFAHSGDRSTGRLGSALTRVSLHSVGRGRPLRTRTRRRLLPEATEDSGQDRFNHDRAGFAATVDLDRLRRDGAWQTGEWRFEARVSAGLRRIGGVLAPYWYGSGEYPLVRWLDEEVRALPYFAEGALRLRVERVCARLTGAAATGGALVLTGGAQGLPEGSRLRLRHRQSGTVLELPVHVGAAGAFTVALPLGRVAVDGPETEPVEHWDPELVRPDGSTLRPVLDGRTQQLGQQYPLPGTARVLYLKQLADGYPQLCTQPAVGLVDGISAEGDGFRLSGRAPGLGAEPMELVLRHTNGIGEAHHPVGPGERFELRVPAQLTTADGGRLPLRRGIWELRIRPVGRPAEEQPLLVAPAALADLPASVEVGSGGGTKRVLLQRRWHDTLVVDSTPVLSAAERSPYTQRQLRTTGYRAARRRPLRDAVLYDVFGGRGYSDSPRAVHAELVRRGEPLEHLWVVDDAQAQVPEGMRAVRSHSPEWYEALATSRYVVGNTHLPDFLERRPGQVVVQTWHGTPLKRIAHDVENAWLADSGYLAALDRETPQWSLLVSPSPFATPILRRAFRYRGEVIESGYPRNDVLARRNDGDAAGIRRRLGIPADRRVVLYAPTWREDQRRQNGDGFSLGLRLDLDAARAELGRDHVLLVRSHAHVHEPLPGAGDDFVHDVSDYPDVQDLMLIADVLVTDYSSVMFDFAITGRPILFFTYDLEHYRDTLRGFYFDFEAESPGPLVPDSAGVIRTLRELAGQGTVPPAYADAYARFRAVHSALEDGSAAARVVNRMLELGR